METATVMMPRKLTAENGAKTALSSEFFETIERPCAECIDIGDVEEDCLDCHGTGKVTERVYVSWSTIKAIYEKSVKLLGT